MDWSNWFHPSNWTFPQAPDRSNEPTEIPTNNPLVRFTTGDIDRGISLGMAAGTSIEGGFKYPRTPADIDTGSMVQLGRIYRGTEAGTTPETAIRPFQGGDMGNGTYFTHDEGIAGTYGGGPRASLKNGTRVVHQYDTAPVFPEDVAYMFGGAKHGEDVHLVSGNGIPLWQGPWKSNLIEDALSQAGGIRVVIGTPDSIGMNQISIRDPSLLRPAPKSR